MEQQGLLGQLPGVLITSTNISYRPEIAEKAAIDGTRRWAIRCNARSAAGASWAGDRQGIDETLSACRGMTVMITISLLSWWCPVTAGIYYCRVALLILNRQRRCLSDVLLMLIGWLILVGGRRSLYLRWSPHLPMPASITARLGLRVQGDAHLPTSTKRRTLP